MKALERFALCVIKPKTFIRGNGHKVISFIKNDTGFRIDKYKWLMLSKDQADAFIPNSEEWINAVGVKVIENCNEGGINIAQEFGTVNSWVLGQMVRKWNIDHYTNQVVLALILSNGESGATGKFRNILGHTNPSKAEFGTIRAVFSPPGESGLLATLQRRSIDNVAHGSGSEKELTWEEAVLWSAKIWTPYDE